MAEHICEKHQTAFTRKTKGNKTWYAHPIIENGETVGWCNEDAKEVAKLESQPSDKVLPEHEQVIEQAKKSVAFDPTRKSIERQKALDIAERWCEHKDTDGKIKTVEVISVASVFESFLENGIQVKDK